jgi:hypothetical protein
VGARDGDVVGGALRGRLVSADGTDGPSDANIASGAGNGDGSDVGRSVGCIVISAAPSIGASVGSRVGTRTPVGFEEAFPLEREFVRYKYAVGDVGMPEGGIVTGI